MERRASAAVRARESFPTGTIAKASDYIRHLTDILRENPNTKIVLDCRVSGKAQEQAENLDALVSWCEQYLSEIGANVIQTFKGVAPGRHLERDGTRSLQHAAEYAKREGAILVAEATNRLIRSRAFDLSPEYRDRLPTHAEFERLQAFTLGVPLATIHDPDLPENKVLALQICRGQTAKNRRGGRPPNATNRKIRNAAVRSLVLTLYELGDLPMEIARNYDLKKTNVYRWIGEHSQISTLDEKAKRRYMRKLRPFDEKRSNEGDNKTSRLFRSHFSYSNPSSSSPPE